MLRTPWK